MAMADKNPPTSSIKSLFDAAPGGFFITDKNATILYANRALEAKTGYSVHETIGKTPGKLWGRQMPSAFYKKLWHVLKEERQPFINPVKNRRKSGEVFDDIMRIAPIFEKDEIAYYIAIQPARTSKNLEDEFTEFMRQGQCNPSLFLQKLSSWILEKPLSLPSSITPSEFLQSYFVEPTQDLYKKRTEDTELLLFAQRKISNFNALYEKYYKTIFGYFYQRLGRDKETSSDLTQETFLRAFSHLSSFVPSNATYQTYLIRIAHNILVNHYRKKFPETHDETILSLLPAKENKIEEREYLIDQAIQKLKPLEQEVIKGMYHEGLSVKEISAKVGKTENAVKLLLSRTRKKLRGFIQD